MYNRYMQSDFFDNGTSNVDYIPITSQPEMNYEQPISSVPVVSETSEAFYNEINPVPCQDVAQRNEKEKVGFLDNLGNLINLKDFDIETLFVIALAFFLLCDRPEDSWTSVIILLVLFLLGF